MPVEGETDSTDLTLLTHELGRAIAITCSNFELVGVNLEKEGTLTPGGKIRFTGCEAYGSGALGEPLGCEISSPGTAPGSQSIESNAGKGALLLHEVEPGVTELVTKIEPLEGTTFVTIFAEECILPDRTQLMANFFLKIAN